MLMKLFVHGLNLVDGIVAVMTTSIDITFYNTQSLFYNFLNLYFMFIFL